MNLPNWMIFFHLSSTLLSDLDITKNCVFCQYTTTKKQKLDFFQLLNHVDFYLKPYLIMNRFHIVPSPSTTLIQGWRGGAERGFRAAYTDCIHVLTREATKYDTQENPDIATWYRKILTHNLSPNVLKQRYGILVPITYKQLNPTASRDEMDLAHVLGWCVEMIRAASVMTTETIGVNQSFGRRKVDRETWAEKHQLGNKAFNDALLMERGVFVLLKHYFGEQATIYYEAVTKAQRVRTLGKKMS